MPLRQYIFQLSRARTDGSYISIGGRININVSQGEKEELDTLILDMERAINQQMDMRIHIK